jgi:hypothetical protein
MTTATREPKSAILTTNEVARRLGVPLWWIRSVIHRGKLATPAKHGPVFLWTPADLPRVRQVLIDEGYLSNGGSS